MNKHCKTLLSLMFALLLGIPMTQGKEKMDVNSAFGSNADFIMGEFTAISPESSNYDCREMVITVYEIEGAQGSYYALIDGKKYKVTPAKSLRWNITDCNGRSRWFSYLITYNARPWYFDMH